MKAVTIHETKDMTSRTKYDMYSADYVKGTICRTIRGNIMATLFMEDEFAVFFCIKYSEYLYDVIDVEYIPDIALNGSVRAVICPFAKDGSISISYSPAF